MIAKIFIVVRFHGLLVFATLSMRSTRTRRVVREEYIAVIAVISPHNHKKKSLEQKNCVQKSQSVNQSEV